MEGQRHTVGFKVAGLWENKTSGKKRRGPEKERIVRHPKPHVRAKWRWGGADQSFGGQKGGGPIVNSKEDTGAGLPADVWEEELT